MTNGGRNLIILGVAAVLIAIATTGISLAIYHSSGDIYLDRSRPGFLPDQDETEVENPAKDYTFSDTGEVTPAVLEDYIQKIQSEIKNLDDFTDPFSSYSLSDEALGIPE